MRTLKGLLVFALLLCAVAASADSNLHTLAGTMDSCSCEFYPVPGGPPCGTPEDPFAICGDWICRAHFVVAAPSPHWDEETPAFINAEIVEQAIGQCGAMHASLPRKVQMLFWLEAHGIDFVHGGIVRSPIRGYYLVDQGAP